MKAIFDIVSHKSSRLVTSTYSTSFSSATKMLSPKIRQDIYNIYGFVRFADEIVDSFHEYPKEALFNQFEKDLYKALELRISLNPILNAFQQTVHKYEIAIDDIQSFMDSMRRDLTQSVYENYEDYQQYIYGSADVVGLMCLKVFVNGDFKKFTALKSSAMALGSAFQKVNFLRDLKEDYLELQRTYFPETNLSQLNDYNKLKIITEIEQDFEKGYEGIKLLPKGAQLGVYIAYCYYKKLLKKLKKTPSQEIKNSRIRIPNHEKAGLLAGSYLKYKLNLMS